ncbi:flagellar assembly peptidoglycan hydrolase FlgJ [Comamonas sp.]
MARAELLPFPSFPLPLQAGAGVAAARAELAGGAYSPLVQEVARDVQQFIAQGSGPAPAMASAQAQWLAHQAAQQLKQQQKQESKTTVAAPVAVPRAAKQRALKPEQQAFLQQIAPWAERAAQQLGVSVRSVMAHAALESGWGKKPLRAEDGSNSWNLFGLKAGAGWRGARLNATTTEYEAGEATKQVQSFRQYADLEASFADYVQLLAHSPRYRNALKTGDDVHAFAHALAKGGYATDPAYADKLLSVSRQIAP